MSERDESGRSPEQQMSRRQRRPWCSSCSAEVDEDTILARLLALNGERAGKTLPARSPGMTPKCPDVRRNDQLTET